MRILLWAPFGAGTHYWGPGTSAFRLYKNNNDKNIKVTLIHGSDFQDDFSDVFYEQIQLGHIDNRNPLSMLRYLRNSYIWLKNNHMNYDVFHGITAYYFTFIPAYFSHKHKISTFIKISGILGGFEQNGKLSKLSGFKNFRLKNANKFNGYISISSDITKSLKKNKIETERIHYIPNGVDIERFSPVSDEDKVKIRNKYSLNNKFTVLYVGGITENKNVIETVFAVHNLIRKGYDIQFVIVGSSRLGNKTENELSNYILHNNIEEYCIRVKHTITPEFYFKAADVFVLNSKHEGLSNSLLEAMSTGLPCIAYPASGTIDLIEDEINGYLTDGTATEIEQSILKLLENEILCKSLAKNARNKIKNKYSNIKVLEQHIELFEKSIEKNNLDIHLRKI